MSTHHPYYRKLIPKPGKKFAGESSRVDFSQAHLASFDEVDAVAKANAQFDDRVAAVLRTYAGIDHSDWWWPGMDLPNLITAGLIDNDTKNNEKYYEYGDGAPPVRSPSKKCLAVLAYPDFFGSGQVAQSIVSEAILASNPGWCGTFGPGGDGALRIASKQVTEGNYDMAQMHLLPMAYRHYDDLTPEAREYLITSLLARGVVHGPGNDDSYTSGFFLGTWSRAGFISPAGLQKTIGETENHILMIMTVRYLTNQLLYQRTPDVSYDNRRNSQSEIALAALHASMPSLYPPVAPHKAPTPGSCAFLLLDLMQRILRDDFSEYNAKGYQQETRWALVNLYNYAYDHEVRLAAKMVLDYLSARFVVSTNDLRRIVPFRRRNEGLKNAHNDGGFMQCGILDWQDGSDPMGPTFAVLAGNVRAYEAQHPPPQDPDPAHYWTWGIRADHDGGDVVVDALSDYRLPPSIHDLFVNDSHRRFYQRLHRTVRDDETEVGGHRNADNMEINAGSPSYLITAGGAPATYAIDPHDPVFNLPRGEYEQQRGVAVTTTFMPTTFDLKIINAYALIQFSSFSDSTDPFTRLSGAWNYGVAPDFACGHQIHLPDWVIRLRGTPRYMYVPERNFTFIDCGTPLSFAPINKPTDRPGFFLAIYQENGFALLEAFDTWGKWLYRDHMTFADFQADVLKRTNGLSLRNNVETHYRTWNGNEFDFVIWNDGLRHGAVAGAEVMNFKYGDRDLRDAFGDAGNVSNKFLNGTVMNSKNDAVVEITNQDLGTKITLDMSDLLHPKRISETGELEQAGFDNEVWLDFDWKGLSQGDACQPFNTIAGAAAAVAENGVVKIIPGQSNERITFGGKRMKLIAPLGSVTIGSA